MIGSQFTHFIKFIFGKDRPITQTTKSEQDALARYANGARTAIEIGVFEGYNTVLIAKAMHPNGIVYGIDPFFKGRMGICWQKQIATTYIRRAGLSDRIKLVLKLSVESAILTPDKVDFIFVDGDHSMNGITTDWKLYSSKLRLGGIIALHDTSASIHQPWKADMGSVIYFNDYIRHQPGFALLETVDSLNIMQKI